MFIFAILILVPALTLAQTDNDALERKLFSASDPDHDGKISRQEHEAFVLSFDTDKDADISKPELKVALGNLDPALVAHVDEFYFHLDPNLDCSVTKQIIDNAFHDTDTNGDGYIDQHEFHVVLHAILTHVGPSVAFHRCETHFG